MAQLWPLMNLLFIVFHEIREIHRSRVKEYRMSRSRHDCFESTPIGQKPFAFCASVLVPLLTEGTSAMESNEIHTLHTALQRISQLVKSICTSNFQLEFQFKGASE